MPTHDDDKIPFSVTVESSITNRFMRQYCSMMNITEDDFRYMVNSELKYKTQGALDSVASYYADQMAEVFNVTSGVRRTLVDLAATEIDWIQGLITSDEAMKDISKKLQARMVKPTASPPPHELISDFDMSKVLKNAKSE